MNLRPVVKTAVSIATAIGSYKIMHDAIDYVTPDEKSNTDKVLYHAGSVAIAGVVSDAATDYTDVYVDKIFDAVDQFTNKTPATTQE